MHTIPAQLRRAALGAAATVALALPAVAQAQVVDTALVRPVRALLGAQGFYGNSVGEFADFVDHGWGLQGHGTLLLDRSGYLGLRFDAGFMNYGNERVRECLTTSCLVTVDVETSYNVFFAGVGPQLQVPDGPLRPYVGGQVGWTFFNTSSTVEGSDPDDQPFARTENYNSNNFALNGYGGIMIPLSSGQTPVMLDLGARYFANGDADYLTPESITIRPGQLPLIDPVRSDANFWAFSVGITVGVR